ncbi:hypothetical protein K523DRAFT_422271 [Schizophyllum commune Tattone D]|nr:hypothetical protein K523DRAFT_422271 [Schizophyllum commune Tattone D]
MTSRRSVGEGTATMPSRRRNRAREPRSADRHPSSPTTISTTSFLAPRLRVVVRSDNDTLRSSSLLTRARRSYPSTLFGASTQRCTSIALVARHNDHK